MTASTTTAWAITTPYQGVLTFTVGRTRVEAIAKFIELVAGLPYRAKYDHLTDAQRRAWRRWKRRASARAVRVTIEVAT